MGDYRGLYRYLGLQVSSPDEELKWTGPKEGKGKEKG